MNPTTFREKKLLFLETLLNNTDQVTKVSPFSTLDGIAEGVSVLASKSEKDIAISLAQLFPDTAQGSELDQCAANFGVAQRFGALGSSGFVRIIAPEGTFYDSTIIILRSTSGVTFQFSESFTVGPYGFSFAKIVCLSTGVQTNSDALQITTLTHPPLGHKECINEFKCIGGRDVESDNSFRQRIKQGGNLLSKGTLLQVQERMKIVNPKVLRCFYAGITSVGKTRIVIATVNGQDLSQNELDYLRTQTLPFLSLKDSEPYGTSFSGVEVLNIIYTPIDISFRVDLYAGVDSDKFRVEIQTQFSRYLDLETFDPRTQKVEWDNLLEIVKAQSGVKYVPDEFFLPRVDTWIDYHSLPRIRGFIMMDLQGTVIQTLSGTFTPVYSQLISDYPYISSVL